MFLYFKWGFLGHLVITICFAKCIAAITSQSCITWWHNVIWPHFWDLQLSSDFMAAQWLPWWLKDPHLQEVIHGCTFHLIHSEQGIGGKITSSNMLLQCLKYCPENIILYNDDSLLKKAVQLVMLRYKVRPTFLLFYSVLLHSCRGDVMCWFRKQQQ